MTTPNATPNINLDDVNLTKGRSYRDRLDLAAERMAASNAPLPWTYILQEGFQTHHLLASQVVNEQEVRR